MAKNRTFHKRFIVEVKGITTNNFMVDFIVDHLSDFILNLYSRFEQIKETKLIVEDVEKDGTRK